MPELPEVETVVRAMDEALSGDFIASAALHREGLRTPFAKDLVRRLEGQRIEHVTRRAKYILAHLKSGDVFVLHLGMSGRVMIHAKGQHKNPEKHDHFVMVTKKNVQLVFRDPRRFGMAFVVHADELDSHPAFKKMGPEPLGNEFSGPVLADALKGRKSNIKVTLLDQRLVAGVGNIYACEALFCAGIDPETEAGKIKGAKAETLAACVKIVLKKAVAAGGTSFRDYRQANGELGYFQQQLAVYDKEGKACPGCTCDIAKTGGILRITQGGRSTFYCPRKQR